MGYKVKGFFVSIWQKLKLLIILAILAGIGYGGWIGWKKFIKKTQRQTNRAGQHHMKVIEDKTK